MKKNLGMKDVGILILGGAHFSSGWNKKIPIECNDKLMEDYFNKSKELKDMRLIVVDPHCYGGIDNNIGS